VVVLGQDTFSAYMKSLREQVEPLQVKPRTDKSPEELEADKIIQGDPSNGYGWSTGDDLIRIATDGATKSKELTRARQHQRRALDRGENSICKEWA
jgi:hypothetical protein